VRYELIDSPTELALQLVPPLTIIDGQQTRRPQTPAAGIRRRIK
jgi:hypothetical protein